MKTLILLIFAIPALAQTNFTVANNTVVWQKVYQDTTSFNQYYAFLKHNHFTVTADGEFIDFSKDFTTQEFKPYGYRAMEFPTLFYDGYIKGNVEFKDGKYRVTINQIIFKDALTLETYNPIEDWFIKNGTLKTSNMHTKVLTTMDAYFLNQFTYQTPDGW